MAGSVDQVKQSPVNGGSTTTGSLSFTSLPAGGKSIIVGLASSSSGGFSPVTDNQSGNTYSQVVLELDPANNNNSAACALFWCPSITTPSGTFTITWTWGNGLNAGWTGVFLLEVAGIFSVDKTGVANCSGLTSGPLVMTASGANASSSSLVVGCASQRAGSAGGGAWTTAPTTGYGTGLIVYTGSNQGPDSVGGYKIVSALETSSMTTPTWTGTGTAAGVIATFNPTPPDTLMGQAVL